MSGGVTRIKQPLTDLVKISPVMRPTDLTSTKELSKIPISLHLLLFVVLAFFFFLPGPKKKKTPNKHKKEKAPYLGIIFIFTNQNKQVEEHNPL